MMMHPVWPLCCLCIHLTTAAVSCSIQDYFSFMFDCAWGDYGSTGKAAHSYFQDQSEWRGCWGKREEDSSRTPLVLAGCCEPGW